MLKKYWKGFLSLLYPNNCLNCEVSLVEGEEIICLRCFNDIPKTNYHKSTPNPLMNSLTGNYQPTGAFAYMKFNKKGIAQKLLHELKYKGNSYVGIVLGEWFGAEMLKEMHLLKLDMIVPVPLHPSKRKTRGFNQAEMIAIGISNQLGVPVVTNQLNRVKNASTQTNKGKVERWKNVDALYELSDPSYFKEKSILLVDDVITTGATIGVAAELLADSGVKAIHLACVATGK